MLHCRTNPPSLTPSHHNLIFTQHRSSCQASLCPPSPCSTTLILPLASSPSLAITCFTLRQMENKLQSDKVEHVAGMKKTTMSQREALDLSVMQPLLFCAELSHVKKNKCDWNIKQPGHRVVRGPLVVVQASEKVGQVFSSKTVPIREESV
ncbi:hypothetical protein E2C01_056601 [Portunus trituberculatus]|uniref:Uncharacterized protein n=1 Tax=Portunus trituberculatus TaxID=210409 RepID=A0A5B7GY63_PORTR|nr:hypothetical protein [Portunus trituberculatus]